MDHSILWRSVAKKTGYPPQAITTTHLALRPSFSPAYTKSLVTMFRSRSLSVDYYAPSTGSSAGSSASTQASTGGHSPPLLWSVTDTLILRIKAYHDNGFYDCDSHNLVLTVQPVEFAAFR